MSTSSIEQMHAFECIRSVKYDYARALDDRNWDLMRSCFNDNLKFEVPATGPVRGADEAVRTLRERFMRFAFSLHECTMPRLTLCTPAEAEGLWEVHTITTTHDCMKLPKASKVHGYGRYAERYRQLDGQWKIASLRLLRRFKDE